MILVENKNLKIKEVFIFLEKMVNCLQTFVVYHVVAMAILMEQEKSFKKIENALHQLIICLGKSQLTLLIE